MTISKAIIPVAGWGTRRLPITKAIEKCMLPLGNRPVVDYVVQDCIDAGITDLYFIVGEESSQLHAYYRPNTELNDYLRRNGKSDLLASVTAPNANYHYIVQPSYGKYGTAVPVDLALPDIEPGESAVVVMGDDCLYNPGGTSDIARLIARTPSGQSAILGVPVTSDDSVPRYGHIVTDAHSNVQRIIEHPDPMPTQFIKNVSKYVLNYDMLTAIHEFVARPKDGEYYIFDAFEPVISAGGILKLVTAEGQYLDAGTAESWLHANQVILGAV